MHAFVKNFDSAERKTAIGAEGLVMISWNENHERSGFHLTKNFVDDAAVGIAPVPAAAKPPAVDDVADEVERLTFVVGKKIAQQFGFGAERSQMRVRYEQGPVVFDPMGRDIAGSPPGL